MTLSVTLKHRLGAFTLDLAFEAPPGITVLFGPSGSGKTSVINAVAGLLKCAEGRVALNGTTLQDSATFLPPHRRRIGYVFQDARLFPHLSVERNLRYGQRYSPKTDHPPFADIVDLLGIAPLLPRRPGALSGGEKSRVALGRALLSGPRLLLADEPLAALDAARKAEILPYFERLRDLGLPILYVTHSAEEVARLATTVIVLQEGRITAQGPVAEILSDPAIMPAGVRQLGAVLTARITAQHDDGLTELEAGGLPLLIPRIAGGVGTTVRLRLPAQDVILSLSAPEGLSAQNVLPGTIKSLRTGEGPGVIAAIETAAGTVLSRLTKRSATRLGLAEGLFVHCIVKTVATAPGDAG